MLHLGRVRPGEPQHFEYIGVNTRSDLGEVDDCPGLFNLAIVIHIKYNLTSTTVEQKQNVIRRRGSGTVQDRTSKYIMRIEVNCEYSSDET